MTARRFIPTREWEDARQVRGLAGEHAALAYLTSCGWAVEAHRFKLGRHDLDLVVRRGSVVAFVEVKTRRSASFGLAAEAVGWRKQRTLARVAELWRLRYGRATDTYRFDLVSVTEGGSGRMEVEHLADAWRLDRR
jgi:putative endonuclease